MLGLKRIGLVLSLLLVGCGGEKAISPTTPDVPVTAVDWTQPSTDAWDYFVSESGEAAVDSGRANPVTGSVVGFGAEPWILWCGHGTCKNSVTYRDRGGVLYLESDGLNSYNGPWVARSWHVGQQQWAWCNPGRPDLSCPPCDGLSGQSWASCAKRNEYAILKNNTRSCTVAAQSPIRYYTEIEWAGVKDWGGTVGRRHTIALAYHPHSPGGWDKHSTNTEVMWLARGLGLVWWEDRALTGGWTWTNDTVVPVASLGLNPAESVACDGPW